MLSGGGPRQGHHFNALLPSHVALASHTSEHTILNNACNSNVRCICKSSLLESISLAIPVKLPRSRLMPYDPICDKSTLNLNQLGPVLVFNKASYRKISWSFEAMILVVRITPSPWNLTGSSAAPRQQCCRGGCQFQSDRTNLNTNPAASRLHEILWYLIGYWNGVLASYGTSRSQRPTTKTELKRYWAPIH